MSILTRDEVFDQWMIEHQGIVAKIARSFAPEPEDFADLSQDILVAIWRSVPSFRSEAKPSTWIWRVALNRAISWQRATPETHTDIAQIAEPASDLTADSGALLARIYAAIRTLKPLDRSILLLSLEGHSYREIADVTGISESNVGARLSRSRSRLSTLLEQDQ